MRHLEDRCLLCLEHARAGACHDSRINPDSWLGRGSISAIRILVASTKGISRQQRNKGPVRLGYRYYRGCVPYFMPVSGSDDGSIGIGAMIVFIAFILVAAVASTMIIKTVEDLEQRGEKTNDDMQNMVNTRPVAYQVILGSADEAGMEECASENGFCSFTGTKTIRYVSITDSARYFDLELTDGTPCTNGVFGDPHGGTLKKCYIMTNSQLIVVWSLAAGSLHTTPEAVSWAIICPINETISAMESDTMLNSNMTFTDGTNTTGAESNFSFSEEISPGNQYTSFLDLYECTLGKGDELSMLLTVDGGGTSGLVFFVDSTDTGAKLY